MTTEVFGTFHSLEAPTLQANWPGMKAHTPKPRLWLNTVDHTVPDSWRSANIWNIFQIFRYSTHPFLKKSISVWRPSRRATFPSETKGSFFWRPTVGLWNTLTCVGSFYRPWFQMVSGNFYAWVGLAQRLMNLSPLDKLWVVSFVETRSGPLKRNPYSTLQPSNW